jgi:hypothetical protein
MRTCSGIKKDGGKCHAPAMNGSNFCLNHDPERRETQRQIATRAGKRGGRGRPRVELTNIRAQLQELKDGVLDGKVDRGDAAVAGNLLNYMTRVIQIELQAKDQEELEARLSRLEEQLDAQEQRPQRRIA